ncbi:MAG TPA: LptF/LptG family permease [bacterium]|nr:LptF/LptG family permease [bacterium]
MKITYRYILMEIMPTFLITVSMLTFLFMTNKVFLLLDLVLNKKAPLGDTLILYFSLMPFVLSLTIPMSMMVATLLAFGRLSSDMEVTAFKSSGIHLFHLIAPVLAFGALVTVGMLYFNDKILPAANYAFKQTHFKILQKQADVAIRERVFIDQFEGYQFYIDHLNTDGLFSQVKVFNHWAPQAPLQTTLAKTGSLESVAKKYQILFHLNDGVMSWDNDNYQTYNRLYFQHYTIHLKLENQLSHMTDIKKDYEEMDLNELSNEIAATTDNDRKRSLRGEFQKRISLPFACVILIWFCAPLGLWTKSKGFIGFVLGLVMIFVYYLMFTVGQIMSERGLVNPVIGLWWPNLLLLICGCFIYYLVVTEHSAFKSFTGFTHKKTA